MGAGVTKTIGAVTIGAVTIGVMTTGLGAARLREKMENQAGNGVS